MNAFDYNYLLIIFSIGSVSFIIQTKTCKMKGFFKKFNPHCAYALSSFGLPHNLLQALGSFKNVMTVMHRLSLSVFINFHILHFYIPNYRYDMVQILSFPCFIPERNRNT